MHAQLDAVLPPPGDPEQLGRALQEARVALVPVRGVRLAQLAPGDVVVDVACGTGDLSNAFANAGAERVLGIDFTFPAVALPALVA